MFDLISAFLALAAMGIGFLAMLVQWPMAAAYGWTAMPVRVVSCAERICGAFLVGFLGCMLIKQAFLWGLAKTPVLMSLAGCLLAIWIFYLASLAWDRIYARSKLTVGTIIVLGGAIFCASTVLLAKSIMA
ncbi:hypothetical protein [Sphingobium sp.]|uniref:hypothetical protein n=1 Tax=Sphingobium TaxID=165695 RepID=UPI001A213604|nr:hypothetical protein [Sphingobium sp.]MBJ7376391.1 hypothetical protein [Sphingobium sp.]